jgi:hypothetical protein
MRTPPTDTFDAAPVASKVEGSQPPATGGQRPLCAAAAVRNCNLMVTDGPFAETKELLGVDHLVRP